MEKLTKLVRKVNFKDTNKKNLGLSGISNMMFDIKIDTADKIIHDYGIREKNKDESEYKYLITAALYIDQFNHENALKVIPDEFKNNGFYVFYYSNQKHLLSALQEYAYHNNDNELLTIIQEITNPSYKG